jgi:hypothetical protein
MLGVHHRPAMDVLPLSESHRFHPYFRRDQTGWMQQV